MVNVKCRDKYSICFLLLQSFSSFIEISFTYHKVLPFKENSNVFSMFTESCSHPI